MSKRIKSLVLCLCIVLSAALPVYASDNSTSGDYVINDIKTFKSELKSLQSSQGISESEKQQLVKETNPKIIEAFIDDKMQKLEKEFNKSAKTLVVNQGSKVINLGDNCQATVIVTDVPEDTISLRSSTPGASTLWKDYGNRLFTTKFEVRTGVLDVDLILVNHYKLSSNGVVLNYGESSVKKKAGDFDLGSATAGSVSEIKKSATKVGSSIHIASTYTYKYSPGLGIDFVVKEFKMNSYVKYSALDAANKQVKVVQSWEGKYI